MMQCHNSNEHVIYTDAHLSLILVVLCVPEQKHAITSARYEHGVVKLLCHGLHTELACALDLQRRVIKVESTSE